MFPQADQYTLADLQGAADIVEEIDANNSYLGFFDPSKDLTDEQKKAQPVCSILHVVRNQAAYPRTTEMKWAGGSFMYSYIWNNRAGATYKFKKF